MKSQKSCEVLDGVDSRDRREVVELCVQQYRQQRLFLPFVAVCLKSEASYFSWLARAETNGVSVRGIKAEEDPNNTIRGDAQYGRLSIGINQHRLPA